MKKLTLFKRRIPKGLECLNCLMPLRGDENFCPNCGQKNDVRKLRVSHFFSEFLAGFISYDSTLWRTLKPIMLSPGKVSLEYIKGKRKSYVNPFRFYFSVSIIYFLVIGLSAQWDEVNSFGDEKKTKGFSINESLTVEQEKEMQAALNEVDSVVRQQGIAVLDSVPLATRSKLVVGKNIERAMHMFKKSDTISADAAMRELNVKPTFLNRVLFYKLKEYSGRNMEANAKAFLNSLVSKISIALFFLLPIFTLFVWFMYLRKRLSYMEHLVFVFNTQTVLFLLLLIFFFVDLVMGTENQWWLTFCLFSLYLFLALRGFYRQGFFKTIVKYFVLNSVYFVLASVGFAVISGVSFLFS